MITNIAWVLPRPRKCNKYIGSFPEHFERRLLELLDIKPSMHKVLHPFGGLAEYGVRVDIKSNVIPDVIGNAENLPFRDNVFDCVILDPPYSPTESMRLYGVCHPKFRVYTKEAVRVLREGGWLVMYHDVATPSIKGTILRKRIFLESRMWHKLRCIHIHRKDSLAWEGCRGQALMELNV